MPPVVLASTFTFATNAEMAEAASTRTGHIYTRWSNPTLEAVETEIAALEGAERCLVTGSGMAAISLALLAATEGGRPLLCQREVYGGTHELATHLLAQRGVAVSLHGVDALLGAVSALSGPAAIHLEIPSNPTLRIADLPAIRRAAPPGSLITVDATFATPLHLRALEHGADLVVHSATKYLAGHHDVVCGCISGSGALMERVWLLRKLLGPVLDPAAAYRLWRGLETLPLRLERQCDSAEILARRLAEHPAVARVHHPSLPDHPDHAKLGSWIARGGAVLSFEVASRPRAEAIADGLERFQRAPSLGGVRSLVSWPAGASHVGLSVEERAESGVAPGLLRLAVGVEPVEELWTDLARVLGAA